MLKHPVMNLQLDHVLRPEIALTLQHVLHLYTVGNFLNAWRNPRSQKSIEQCFDSPQQARHAAQTCAAWLGVATPPSANILQMQAWWRDDAPLHG